MGKITSRDMEILQQNTAWLKRISTKYSVKQTELAAILKVTPATISRYFSGGQISAENIMEICTELRCKPPAWLQFKEMESKESEYVHKTLLRIQGMYENNALTADDLIFLGATADKLSGLNQRIDQLQDENADLMKKM